MVKGVQTHIDELKDSLNNKRGEWQIVHDEEQALRRKFATDLNPLVVRKANLTRDISAIEKAVAALTPQGTPELGHSIGEFPKATKGVVRYERKPMGQFQTAGSRTLHRIDFVAVMNGTTCKGIVFECDCESFRFTKGQLKDGKTCKHIQYQVANRSRTATERLARLQLRSVINANSRPRISGVYNFRWL